MRLTLVCRDRFSGLVWTYPAETKDADEVEEALRHFCGRNAPVVSVASDRAPEILKAIREVGFTSEPSIPGDPIHNSFAESNQNQDSRCTTGSGLNASLSGVTLLWKIQRRFRMLQRGQRRSWRTRGLLRIWGKTTKGTSFPLELWCGFGISPRPHI